MTAHPRTPGSAPVAPRNVAPWGPASVAPQNAAPRSPATGRAPGTVRHDAIVLAGGRGSRLGGADKGALRLDGRCLLDRVLAACRGAERVVVVGPRVDLPGHPDVLWAREDPPLSGPAAALVAGIAALDGRADPPGHVLILACDMPFAADAVPALLAAAGVADGASAVDDDDRPQPLLSCARRSALLAAVAAATGDGPIANAPLRAVLGRLDLAPVPAPRGSARDVDTPDDAARLGIAVAGAPGPPTAGATARTITTPQGDHMSDQISLDDWARELVDGLGLPASAADYVQAVLDVTRDAAHSITRPAAPIAAFLVGMAAGRDGADPESVARACEIASRLARAHEDTA